MALSLVETSTICSVAARGWRNRWPWAAGTRSLGVKDGGIRTRGSESGKWDSLSNLTNGKLTMFCTATAALAVHLPAPIVYIISIIRSYNLGDRPGRFPGLPFTDSARL